MFFFIWDGEVYKTQLILLKFTILKFSTTPFQIICQ
uniref:Uncharacterized protein n=1 Tax=viral metagenome TaxID=1070528 RepID=A0A6C0ADG1_9ZZZZ